MSRVFTNINVRTGDQKSVASAVVRLPRRMTSIVAPPVNGWVTVYDEVADAPDEDRLSGYTVMLSDRLKTQVIGFLVYESDVLIYTLAENGKLLDHYSSWPDYFDESLPPEEYDSLSGDAGALSRLNTSVGPEQIRAVLDAEHDFAEEKLEALVRLLGLPESAATWGYNDLVEAAEESPEDLPPFWPDTIKLEQMFQTI
jgi:hypothetical protein